MHKLRKKGRYWYLRERSGGEDTEVTTGCTDKKAAELWARQRERDRADPDGARRREAGKFTLQQAVDAEHARHLGEKAAGNMSEATVGAYEGKLGILLSVLGTHCELAGLDANVVDGFIATRRKDGVVQHTIYKEIAVLGLVLRGAKRAGKWFGDVDAVLPMNFGPEYTPESRNLSVTDVRAVMGELKPHRAAWVALAAGAGAEKAALERAERGDFDKANRLVRVRGTKTEQRERVVPIVLDVCAEFIEYAFAHGGAKRPLLLEPWGGSCEALKAACGRVGIEPFSTHTLRHAFTIWHLAAGVGFDDLAKALGHSGTTMLHRVYGHMKPEDLRDRMARSVSAARKSGEDAGKSAPAEVLTLPETLVPEAVSDETPRRNEAATR